MTIAGACIVKNEADIICASLSHLFAEGVDEIYVADAMSTDGTRGVYEMLQSMGFPLTVIDDDDPYCHQDTLTNSVIARAAADGHEWIIPFDADEFPYATNGQSIADVLEECPYDKLYMRMWEHRDWEYKEAIPKPLPKVAFRWQPGAEVTFGNHDVRIPGGQYDILELRELQYRSFEHFCFKVRQRNATLAPESRQIGHGAHISRLESFTEEQLLAEWETMCLKEVVFDPIPSRLPSSFQFGDHTTLPMSA